MKKLEFANGSIRKLVKAINDSPNIPLQFEYEKKAELDPDRRLVMICNHSGWFAFDGLIAGHFIFDELKENYMKATGKKEGEFCAKDVFTTIVHDALVEPPVKYLFPPSLIKDNFIARKEYVKILRKKDWDKMPRNFAIFPEDERGATKSFLQAYKLKKFKTGFLRHALATDSDILVGTTVGNEELLPSLGQLKLENKKLDKHLILPIPMLPFLNPMSYSLFKYPKFKVTAHEVIAVESIRERVDSGESLEEIAETIRQQMQVYLDEETFHRPLRVASKFLDKFRQTSEDLLDFEVSIKL